MRGDVEGELSCEAKKSTKGCSEVIRTETVEAPTCFMSETNVGLLGYIPVSVTWLCYLRSAITPTVLRSTAQCGIVLQYGGVHYILE